MFIIPHLLYPNDAERINLRYLEQDHALFWEIRRQRSPYCVSASDIPGLCGFDTNKTRIALWRQKALGEQPRFSARALELMEEGKRREPEARTYFCRAHGYRAFTTGMWVHPLDQRISASPDALLVTEHGLVPLEIKSPDSTTLVNLQREHKDTLQLQTQIQCVGAPYGYLYYYYSEGDERNSLIWVPASDTQWMEIVALVDDFLGYVCGGQPPPVQCRLSEREYIIKRYKLKYAQFTTSLELLYCGRCALSCAKDSDNRGSHSTKASTVVVEAIPAATNKRGAPQEGGKGTEETTKRARPAGLCDEWPHAEDSSGGSAGSQ